MKTARMKILFYTFALIGFLNFSPILRADLPPVIQLLQHERTQALHQNLSKHFGSDGYSLTLKLKAKLVESRPDRMEVEIKKINGTYPSEGRFLPQVGDSIGEIEYGVTQALSLKINRELSGDEQKKLKASLSKLIGLNPSGGDRLILKIKTPAPIIPEPAVLITEAPLNPPITQAIPPAETEQPLLHNWLGNSSLPWQVWAGLAILLPLGWMLKTKSTSPTTTQRLRSRGHLQTKAPMELLTRIEKAEAKARTQSMANEDLGRCVELDMEYELNMVLDGVTLQAEASIAIQEQRIQEHAPLDLYAALAEAAHKDHEQADFSYFKSMPIEQLQQLLGDESPLTRALMISRLPLNKAEKLYGNYSQQEQFEIVWELGNILLIDHAEEESTAVELQVKADLMQEPGLHLAFTNTSPAKSTDAQGILDIESIALLPLPILTEVAHHSSLESLVIALFHAPEATQESLLVALEPIRRKEFLQLTRKLKASLQDSLIQQGILLALTRSLLAEQETKANAKTAQG